MIVLNATVTIIGLETDSPASGMIVTAAGKNHQHSLVILTIVIWSFHQSRVSCSTGHGGPTVKTKTAIPSTSLADSPLLISRFARLFAHLTECTLQMSRRLSLLVIAGPTMPNGFSNWNRQSKIRGAATRVAHPKQPSNCPQRRVPSTQYSYLESRIIDMYSWDWNDDPLAMGKFS